MTIAAERKYKLADSLNYSRGNCLREGAERHSGLASSLSGRIERGETMDETYYRELITLLHEKINRLEREKDEKRREIDRLKAELKKLQSLNS